MPTPTNPTAPLKRLALASVLGLATVGFSACGEKSQTASVSEAEPNSETSQPASATTPGAPPAFTAARTYTARAIQADDTESEYVWEIGSMTQAENRQMPEGFARDACAVDDERDALVPFRFTAKNLTSGFPSRMLPLLSAGDPDQGGVSVSFGTTLNGSPVCKEGSLLLEFTDVQPDTTSSIEGTLVLNDYFTPETPNGNDESYKALQGAMGRVTCLEGPGSTRGVFHLTGSNIDVSSQPGTASVEDRC